MRLRPKLVAAALGCAALGACGGATTPAPSVTTAPATAAPTVAAPTPSPTPDIPALKAQFTALVAAVSPAFYTMNTYLEGSKGQTFDQIQAHTAIYAAALTKFDTGLLALPWPAQFLADAHALVTDDGAVEGNMLSAANITDEAAWNSAGETEIDVARTAAAIIRADLGLPARVVGKDVY